MKYLRPPYPNQYFLVKIPVNDGQEYVDVAFDTKEELDQYTRSIPDCSFPGVTTFFVVGILERSLVTVDCYSFCTLVHRCDEIREKIKH